MISKKTPRTQTPEAPKDDEMHETIKALFAGLLTGAVIGTAYHKHKKSYLFFSVHADGKEDTAQTEKMSAMGIERMPLSKFYLRMFKLCVQYGKCTGRSKAHATNREAELEAKNDVLSKTAAQLAATRSAPQLAATRSAPQLAATRSAHVVGANYGSAAAMAGVLPASSPDGARPLAVRVTSDEKNDFQKVGHGLEKMTQKVGEDLRKVGGEIGSAAKHLVAEGEAAIDDAMGGSEDHDCPLLCEALLSKLNSDEKKSGPLMYLKKLLRNLRLTIFVQYEETQPPLHFQELCRLLSDCFKKTDHAQVVFYGPVELTRIKEKIESKRGKLSIATIVDDVEKMHKKGHPSTLVMLD